MREIVTLTDEGYPIRVLVQRFEGKTLIEEEFWTHSLDVAIARPDARILVDGGLNGRFVQQGPSNLKLQAVLCAPPARRRKGQALGKG